MFVEVIKNVDDEHEVKGLSGAGVFLDQDETLNIVGMVRSYKVRSTIECLHLKSLILENEYFFQSNELSCILELIIEEPKVISTLSDFERNRRFNRKKNRRNAMVGSNEYTIRQLQNEIDKLEARIQQYLKRIQDLELKLPSA